ncbi:neuromodulin [Rhinophrynus dorsalis]
MLCCMRRTKQVEKNEDGDQKIEQDANKPEDKAHKAATKIQASFRGHIIRKKLKGDKKGDENAEEPVENHKGEDKEEVGKTENGTPNAVEPTTDGPLAGEDKKNVAGSPVADKKQEGTSEEETKSTEKSQGTPSEEKKALAETESTTNGTTENSSGADASQGKDESKQADVPAANQEAAPAKEQPKEETADSSQAEGKKGDDVDETKPSESAQQEEVASEETKANQENP